MSVDEPAHARLDRLAEEFIARRREGLAPSVSAYARAHPDLAEEIEGLFPLLLDLEAGGPAEGTTLEELGDYTLLREIGRGGMGVVYEAFQKTLGRRVALKVLPKQMTLDPRFLERFRLEAQAAARLQHPNIVPVIGWGEHDGVYYYTMQYVDGCGLDEVLAGVRDLSGGGGTSPSSSESGGSLAKRMLTGAWKEKRDGDATRPASERPAAGRAYYDNAAKLLLQAAEGIAAAHANGVLHRDVKPSNLLLDDGGTVYISDFGLCKDTSEDGVTQPGDLLGTFRYMAPERFEGVSDVQGDVYGLGITLYELLTREAAYKGDDRAAIAAQVTRAPPPRPRKLDVKIPRDLELITLGAINRDRGERYATADALAADLRAYLERKPISARPPSFGYVLRTAIRRHKGIALVSAAALIALVASTAYYVGSLREKETTARFGQYVASIAAAETALRDHDVSVARRRLEEAPAEFRSWEWHHLWSRLDRSLRSFPGGSEPVKSVRHSPDGTRVAISAGAMTRIHDQQTMEEVGRLQHRSQVFSGAWHPAGTQLAVTNYNGVELWSWPAAERTMEWPVGTVREAAFSPEGGRLAAGGHDGQLRIWDLATNEEIVSTQLNSEIYAVAFDRTGTRVATGTWDARVTVLDAGTGAVLWSERCGRSGVQSLCFLGADQVAATSSDGHVQIRSVATGKLLETLGHDERPIGVVANAAGTRLITWGKRIHIWDPTTATQLMTYRVDGEPWCCTVHPAGRALLVGSERGSVSEWALPEGQDPDIAHGDHMGVMDIDFSPSGGHFASACGGSRIVRIYDAITHEECRNWIGHGGTVNEVLYSPDGRFVASADFNGEVLVWRVTTDELVHRIRAIPEGQYARGPWVNGLAFSADAALLYTAGNDGVIRVWDVETGTQQRELALVEHSIDTLHMSRGGRLLAAGDGKGVIYLLDPRSLAVQRTLEGHTSFVLSLAFQPGGHLLASASWDRTVRLWDLERGSLVRVLRTVHGKSASRADALMCVSFLHDGTRVAASSVDCAARLWDTASGQLVATLRGEHGWMETVAFSPDGTRLITGEDRGLLRCFETRPLRERWQAMRPAPDVDRAASALLAATASRDPDQQIQRIASREEASDEVRELALRRAYRARGTLEALIERLWVKFLDPDIDSRECLTLLGIAAGVSHHARHRSLQDPRRDTLYLLGTYRSGRYQNVLHWSKTSLMQNAGRNHHLHAIDLSVVAMAHAKLEEPQQAQTHLAAVEALLITHPDVRDARGITALLAEAKALIK